MSGAATAVWLLEEAGTIIDGRFTRRRAAGRRVFTRTDGRRRKQCGRAVDASFETRYPCTLVICGASRFLWGRNTVSQAPVAQWIEYCPPKAGVAGSIPAGRAKPSQAFSGFFSLSDNLVAAKLQLAPALARLSLASSIAAGGQPTGERTAAPSPLFPSPRASRAPAAACRVHMQDRPDVAQIAPTEIAYSGARRSPSEGPARCRRAGRFQNDRPGLANASECRVERLAQDAQAGVTYRIRQTKGCAPGNRAQPFCHRCGGNTNST